MLQIRHAGLAQYLLQQRRSYRLRQRREVAVGQDRHSEPLERHHHQQGTDAIESAALFQHLEAVEVEHPPAGGINEAGDGGADMIILALWSVRSILSGWSGPG